MNLIEKLLNGVLGKNPAANNTKQPQNTQPKITCEVESDVVVKHHRVAGVSHYIENILLLAKENPDYFLKKNEFIKRKLFEQPIYQYIFSYNKVELIPEPTNQYDQNAVQVLIDGNIVGYIKSGSCKHILNLISENRIEKIEAKIKGGKYKCLRCYGDDEKEDCEMENEKDSYRIELTIYERNK